VRRKTSSMLSIENAVSYIFIYFELTLLHIYLYQLTILHLYLCLPNIVTYLSIMDYMYYIFIFF
jgi:hypothetical protein